MTLSSFQIQCFLQPPLVSNQVQQHPFSLSQSRQTHWWLLRQKFAAILDLSAQNYFVA
jgi:hypothetical protein